MNPVGLKSEKGCAGDAQQKLKTAGRTSRQIGRPHQQTRICLKREKRKNWLRVPDGCLTSRQTGRLTVGRNITLILTIQSPISYPCGSRIEYLRRSLRVVRDDEKGTQYAGV
jgi:hypothetical protein